MSDSRLEQISGRLQDMIQCLGERLRRLFKGAVVVTSHCRVINSLPPLYRNEGRARGWAGKSIAWALQRPSY